jgi:hypothetical protein
VEFISDHPVASAAILLGVLVLPCLGLLALRALHLYRTLKASKSAVEPRLEQLMARAELLEADVARLTETRLPAVTTSLGSLQRRLGEVKVVAKAASEGAGALTAPLRYLGR